MGIALSECNTHPIFSKTFICFRAQCRVTTRLASITDAVQQLVIAVLGEVVGSDVPLMDAGLDSLGIGLLQSIHRLIHFHFSSFQMYAHRRLVQGRRP